MRARLWAVLSGFLSVVFAVVVVWGVFAQMEVDMATAEPIILMVGTMSAGFLSGTFGVLAYVFWTEA